jgi:hypothetical protein
VPSIPRQTSERFSRSATVGTMSVVSTGTSPGRPIGRLHEEWHRREVTYGLLLYDTLGEPRLEREPVIGCDNESGLAVEIQTLQPVDQDANHLVDEPDLQEVPLERLSHQPSVVDPAPARSRQLDLSRDGFAFRIAPSGRQIPPGRVRKDEVEEVKARLVDRFDLFKKRREVRAAVVVGERAQLFPQVRADPIRRP